MAYEFRARSAGEIVDAAFRIYRAHWWTTIKTMGALVLPLGVVQAVLQALAQTAQQEMQTSDDPAAAIAVFALSLLMQLLASLLALAGWVAGAAVISQTAGVCRGEQPSFQAGWSAVREKLGRVIGGGAVITALTMLGGYLTCCCCGLGGLVLTIYLSALMPVIMVEELTIGAALQRSFKLVGKGFWQVVAVQLIIFLIILVPILVIGVPAIVLLSASSLSGLKPGFASNLDPLLYLGINLFTALFGALTGPLYTIGSTLTYFDLRVKQEGFDLEQAALSAGMTMGGISGGPPSA